MIEDTAARDPATRWTMSANTVVVATTVSAPGAGVASLPLDVPPAAAADAPGDADAGGQPARRTASVATARTVLFAVRPSLIVVRTPVAPRVVMVRSAPLRRPSSSSPGSGDRARTAPAGAH